MGPCTAASRRARAAPDPAASARRCAPARGPRRAREGPGLPPSLPLAAGDRPPHDHEIRLTRQLTYVRGLARPIGHGADVAELLLRAKRFDGVAKGLVIGGGPLRERAVSRAIHPDQSRHDVLLSSEIGLHRRIRRVSPGVGWVFAPRDGQEDEAATHKRAGAGEPRYGTDLTDGRPPRGRS